MLHPNQFQVNEAWIAFKLNDRPIRTEQDGDFDFIALMDTASCFILSSASVPAHGAEPTEMESRRLLQQGQERKKQLPKTLLVPSGQPAQFLAAAARRKGIEVVCVEENQLLIFIGEAREGFRERFGSGDAR
uniref:hypothetical protein n=1 Tax=Nitrospira cf. moscoviensis SBR1015 TaxID=96242 RepID=UPI0011209750|nr:hypothetical protein [Nitrospira cf. moscoviensis SBR1015]